MTKRGKDEVCDGIDISMLLDKERDLSMEDSQEELLGIATVSPTIETSRAALAVAVG